MRFDILTIFPDIFDSYLNESIIKRAIENKKIKVAIHDIRAFSKDKHNRVDDSPYGGGVGMVMKVEPIYRALKNIYRRKKSCVVLLSPRGKRWNQQLAQEYSQNYDQVIFICGRYEGIDERIMEFVDYQISLGDFVLTGGELPALTILDSLARLVPGVLGKDESSQDESHSKPGYIEYPHYTRPEHFRVKNKTYSVPKVLLSGNHKEIEQWKKDNAFSQKGD